MGKWSHGLSQHNGIRAKTIKRESKGKERYFLTPTSSGRGKMGLSMDTTGMERATSQRVCGKSRLS